MTDDERKKHVIPTTVADVIKLNCLCLPVTCACGNQYHCTAKLCPVCGRPEWCKT